MLNGSGYFTDTSDSLLIETSILPDTSALEPDDGFRYESILPDTKILKSVDSIKYESRLINNADDLN